MEEERGGAEKRSREEGEKEEDDMGGRAGEGAGDNIIQSEGPLVTMLRPRRV